MTADAPPGGGIAPALGAFLAALAFFTRVPLPARYRFEAAHEHAAAPFAPLVGWIVGLAAALAYAVAGALLPPSLAVLAAMLAAAAITGALHEDGLADFCDGFGAAADRARTLEIMRDPRTGAFGVVGLVAVLATRYLALLEIARIADGDALVVGAVLVAGHAASRLVAVSYMHDLDYARAEPDAKSRAMARRMPGRALALAGVAAAVPVAALAPLGAAAVIAAIAGAGVAWLALGRAFRRRLGGYTGDCLGAAQQIAEALFYVGVCAGAA